MPQDERQMQKKTATDSPLPVNQSSRARKTNLSALYSALLYTHKFVAGSLLADLCGMPSNKLFCRLWFRYRAIGQDVRFELAILSSGWCLYFLPATRLDAVIDTSSEGDSVLRKLKRRK